MPTFTQRNRLISIETPLGPDDLGLVGFTGSEELGRLFQYNVEMVSDNLKISFDDLIGQKASIRLETTKGQQPRYFHGYISRMTQLASRGRYARYHATIVPWLWLLTRTSDCCIFQDKTVPQILQAVFKRCGVAEFELRLNGTYSPLTYCVQYRETDFNFVSRLMEQEGIYYFFKHEMAKHTLVLADSPSAHATYPGYDKITYRPSAAHGQSVENILDWGMGKELQSGAYAQTDFNFETPSKSLLTQSKIKRKYGFANLEIFDYPGEYSDTSDGDRIAKIRIQELQSHYETLEGEADSRGICAGYTFTLEDHPRSDQERKYLVKSTHLSAHAGDFETEGASGSGSDGSTFHCSFAAFDTSENFRTERATPKPLIHGVQTAMVTGPAGQEIYVDKYGRVKVQFHWDRYGQNDENSSCWVRVSQVWTGKNWGHIANPHVGEEVIVSFLEGDPDQPTVVGRLYNAEHMPPYPLPQGAAIIGAKSQSTKTTGVYNIVKQKAQANSNNTPNPGGPGM
jgi:type VI secretion system secreted protein VgrG